MRRYLIVAASWLALATSAQAAPQSFVYKGAGCTGVAALSQYTGLTGRKVDGAADFLDYTSTWANLISETNWALGCWQGKVSNLSIGVPMAVVDNDGSPLHDVAAGDYNTYFKQIGQSLVSHGFANAYLRIGWEFNGGWYPWSAAKSPSLWIQGFQQAVNTLRSVPGQHFTIVWNTALYEQQFWPSAAYPGDSYVDVIATDAYNVSYDYGYTVPTTRWNSVYNDSWGVANVVAFAKQHNKPYAFPEWGTGFKPDGHGGGDDPMFLANMQPIVANSLYASYWDYAASDYNALLSDGALAKTGAMATLIAQYGSTSAGAGSGFPVETNVGAIIERYSAPFTPTPLSVTATGGYATALQNAPGHYNIVVWTSGDIAGAVTVKFAKPVANANLYDPTVGSNPTKALGSISSTTITLSAGHPLILAVSE
jgi:hypothetical protein